MNLKKWSPADNEVWRQGFPTCVTHAFWEQVICHYGVHVALGTLSLSRFFIEFCFPSSLPSSAPTCQAGLSLKENIHDFEVHAMFY